MANKRVKIRSTRDIINFLKDGAGLSAKDIREFTDNDPEIVSYLDITSQVDKDLIELNRRFKLLVSAAKKAEAAGETRVVIQDVAGLESVPSLQKQFTVESILGAETLVTPVGERTEGQKQATPKRAKELFRIFSPDILSKKLEGQSVWELGHTDLSPSRARVGAILTGIDEQLTDTDLSLEDRKYLQARKEYYSMIFLLLKRVDDFVFSESHSALSLQQRQALVLNDIGRQLEDWQRNPPSLEVNYQQDIKTLQGLSGVVTLSYEHRSQNQAKAAASQKIGGWVDRLLRRREETLFDAADNFFDSYRRGIFRSSPSVFDDIEDVILSLIDPKKKDILRISRTSKAKGASTKTPIRPKTRAGGKIPKEPTIRGKESGQVALLQEQQNNPLRLFALINSRLSNQVSINMKAPALRRRTGRLADSVRLVDINRTPQGFLSFGYTYQLNPYQVFEVGKGKRPWASKERDPRTLIDKSVRQIATELLRERIFTRRVA